MNEIPQNDNKILLRNTFVFKSNFNTAELIQIMFGLAQKQVKKKA